MSSKDNVLHELLSKLISISSSYPYEKELSDFIFNYLVSRGYKVFKQEVVNGRYNLFVEKGRQKNRKAILFYGHLDTVDTKDDKTWKSDPLKATTFQDKLYGLGASDMKGGIVAFLEAIDRSQGYTKIFLAVDEENISEGAWKAVKEKRNFFEDVAMVISAEPSFGRNLNEITTGRTGRCVFEISFKGKPEHIIKYKQAVDALEKLSDFGQKLYKNRDRMFKSADTVVQLRKVFGESKGMSVVGEAIAEIEVILGAEDSINSVQKALQNLTSDRVALKTRKTPYLEGYKFEDFPYKELFAKVIKRNTNKEMKVYTRKSVADDNVLATLKIPVLTWGAEGGNEHAANEYVDLKSLEKLSKMYKELLDEIKKI